MMTSLKLKWMEKHKVLHCFILINLQQPTVKSPKYMFPHNIDVDIDIFQKCQYIENRYFISIF